MGIPKATIIINGKDQTTSGSDGSFSLENMKTGTYRLTARVDNVAFEEMSVEITPKTPQLPNLIASGYILFFVSNGQWLKFKLLLKYPL